MRRTTLCFGILILLLASPCLWAKSRHPTATPTPTPSPTATPTAVPASVDAGPASLYGFDQAWGSSGSSPFQLSQPTGISISTTGLMAIADTGNNRIVLWDTDGKPISAFGAWGTSAVWRNPPQFNHPEGILIHPSGQYFVADTGNNRIVAVDQRGMAVTAWGRRGTGDGEFDSPRAFTVGKAGDVWVLDSGNSRVQVFSALGAFKFKWGTFGTDPGQLNNPLGIDLNLIEQVHIANTQNNRYEIFNTDGTPVTYQGWMGNGPNQYTEAGGLTNTPSGWIAVVDGTNGRVEFYNHRFEYVGDWKATNDPAWQGPPPHFRGIDSDQQNRLYITDMANSRIIRLKPLQKMTSAPVRTPTIVPDQQNLYGGQNFPVR